MYVSYVYIYVYIYIIYITGDAGDHLTRRFPGSANGGAH